MERASLVAWSRASVGPKKMMQPADLPEHKWYYGHFTNALVSDKHNDPSGSALTRDFDLKVSSALSRLLREHKPISDLNPYAPANNLRRCRESYQVGWDHWYSYSSPLSLYSHLLSDVLPRFFSRLRSIQPASDSDANAILKKLSDWSAERMEITKDTRYSILIGLNTAGQARRADADTVVAAAEDWVTGPTTLGLRHRRWVESWISGFVSNWFTERDKHEHLPRLTFSEFLDDPTRWATSGSAPSVEFAGHNFRNKWAFAVDVIAKHGSVFNWYQKFGNLPVNSSECNVALKEESTKVRLIIAAPISSILRQSYILECLGTPKHLKSTLSHPDIVEELTADGWGSLVGLDASKFDHNVPFWLLRRFYYQLYIESCNRGLVDLAQVIHEEFESLKSTVVLVSHPNGKRRIKYRKGILSGWKLTSLLDSMISQCTCDFIFDNTEEVFDYCVQGDDILLRSYESMDVNSVISAAEEFGMIVNRPKSTTGPYAEFLKYLLTSDGSFGYPARALRSIFWANPWLPELEAKTPLQVVKGWMTLASRIAPYHKKLSRPDMWRRFIRRDLARWSLKTEHYWEGYLLTPASVGGACPLEWVAPVSKYYTIRTLVARSVLSNGKKLSPIHALGNAFGAYSSALNTPKQVQLTPSSTVAVSCGLHPCSAGRIAWLPDTNHFKSMLSWLSPSAARTLSGKTQDLKDIAWPPYANLWSPLRKIRWLLQSEKLTPSYPLTVSPYAVSSACRTLQNYWRLLISTSKLPLTRRLGMSMGLLLDHKLRRHASAYHTL